MKENDTFRLRKPVEALVIGERRAVTLQPGQLVSVVLVHGNPGAPTAYEVEAKLEGSDTYGLATVDSSDVG